MEYCLDGKDLVLKQILIEKFTAVRNGMGWDGKYGCMIDEWVRMLFVCDNCIWKMNYE